MTSKNVAVIVLMGIFLLIIDLIRRERLTFKYAFGWIAAVLVGLMIALADKLFQSLAVMLGFTLLSNFLFFCCAGVAVILGLLLTVLLCQQSQRNEAMAKKIAWLEHELEQSQKSQKS